MATHSSILAWEIPWMGSLVGYSPWGHKSWILLRDWTNTMKDYQGLRNTQEILSYLLQGQEKNIPGTEKRTWLAWRQNRSWRVWVTKRNSLCCNIRYERLERNGQGRRRGQMPDHRHVWPLSPEYTVMKGFLAGHW